MESWRKNLKEDLEFTESPVCRELALSLTKTSGQVSSSLTLDDLISKLESESKGALGQKRFHLERTPDGFRLATNKLTSNKEEAWSYILQVRYEPGKTQKLRLSFEPANPNAMRNQLLFILIGQPVLLFLISRDLKLMWVLFIVIPLQLAVLQLRSKSLSLANRAGLLRILCKNAEIRPNEISLETSIVK